MSKLDATLNAARTAAKKIALAETDQKNAVIYTLANLLREKTAEILEANQKDVAACEEAGKTEALIDRLKLSTKRIEGIAKSLEQIIELPDPIGSIYDKHENATGLRIGRMRVPLGVIGIIFESRPNVVIDAGVLCLKSGNAAILRGGSEAKHSNNIFGDLIEEALTACDLPKETVQVIRDTDRALVLELMQARGKVDLLIPRGGENLIKFVDENAKVPIVLHYKGVCHTYVDKDGDLDAALEIAHNAKVQRPGVCNAMETLLIHEIVADSFLPAVVKHLQKDGVTFRGCEKCRAIMPEMEAASESDWESEYLDLILAVKIVANMEEAIEHIAKYGSNHSEAIITFDEEAADKFINDVDASCVLVNASTRFNDGGQLGLGAEIGISTTKLHAYGPMGMNELTTSKFIVFGEGHIRQ